MVELRVSYYFVRRQLIKELDSLLEKLISCECTWLLAIHDIVLLL